MNIEPETQTAYVNTAAEVEKRKQTKKELFWEFFRFLLVGGGSTVCDYLVFWLLDGVLLPKLPFSGEVWSTLALWTATAVGFLVGMLINWALSILFVFRAMRNREEATSTKSFGVFTLVSVIGLAMTVTGVWILAKIIPEFQLFGRFDFFGTTWRKWVAKVIMTSLVLLWNYFGKKLLVFKS